MAKRLATQRYQWWQAIQSHPCRFFCPHHDPRCVRTTMLDACTSRCLPTLPPPPPHHHHSAGPKGLVTCCQSEKELKKWEPSHEHMFVSATRAKSMRKRFGELSELDQARHEVAHELGKVSLLVRVVELQHMQKPRTHSHIHSHHLPSPAVVRLPKHRPAAPLPGQQRLHHLGEGDRLCGRLQSEDALA